MEKPFPLDPACRPSPRTGAPALTARPWRLLGACLIMAGLLLSLMPASAFALQTAKCTARPNADTGSDVYGGMETRITWEGQMAPDESLKALSLTLPQGTAYEPEDTRVTLLSGENLMTRANVEAEVEASGETLALDFAEPTPAGGYLRVEVYGVVFPGSGGNMPVTGTYTLADGTTLPIEDVAPIVVKGTSLTEQLARYLEEQEWVQAWNSNKFLRRSRWPFPWASCCRSCACPSSGCCGASARSTSTWCAARRCSCRSTSPSSGCRWRASKCRRFRWASSCCP